MPKNITKDTDIFFIFHVLQSVSSAKLLHLDPPGLYNLKYGGIIDARKGDWSCSSISEDLIQYEEWKEVLKWNHFIKITVPFEIAIEYV